MRQAGSLAILLLFSVPAFAQDRAALDDAAIKAIEHVKANRKGHFAEQVFLGLAILAEGSTLQNGRYSDTLRQCMNVCMRDMRFGGVEEHWFYGLSLLFLCEIYKKNPSEELKARMQDLVGKLEKNQEASGGWSHKKGHKYDPPVNASDLAIVTGLVMAALGNAKSCGCAVSQAVLDRAIAYCVSCQDGKGGLKYAPGYPNPDAANSRAALMMVGLKMAGTQHELNAKAAQGVAARVKECDKGHAFPPIHFFASALGNYYAGQFNAFKAEWMAKILSMREKDGSILFKNHETHDYERKQLGTTTISTAAMALILQLEKGNVFKPAAAAGSKPAPAAPPAKNPFSQKR